MFQDYLEFQGFCSSGLSVFQKLSGVPGGYLDFRVYLVFRIIWRSRSYLFPDYLSIPDPPGSSEVSVELSIVPELSGVFFNCEL